MHAVEKNVSVETTELELSGTLQQKVSTKGYDSVRDNDHAVNYFHSSPECFDQNAFRRSLDELPLVPACKKAIDTVDQQFDRRFCKGENIRHLIYERAAFIDCIIHYVWRQFDWEDDVSLLAVGGYGRGELHPKSDIDILILSSDGIGEQCREHIESFIALLWDIGLNLGHSVRTLRECKLIARDDITVFTSIMESRLLQGSTYLVERLTADTSAERMWSNQAFFSAKMAEQQRRHEKYDDVEYNLEPNVKNAPGGLRDIQTVQWVAKRFFAVKTLQQLDGKGFFTNQEYALLCKGEEFLWRVRYGLHMLAKRPEERLLFDYQRKLAKLFGYEDGGGRLAVEQFMHHYYQTVLSLRELNDVLLQFLDEVILKRDKSNAVTPINERFQLRCGYIEASHTNVFVETPSALLEIFVLAGSDPAIEGIRASTIRLIRESRHLIDQSFRDDSNNNQLFLALLRSPYNLVTQLRRMKRYGILGAYLPEFGRIIGQMQHDLFHMYTVDDHTLLVIKNMYDFQSPDADKKFPIAAAIVNNLEKIELLYIAGLYHDIAKGRGGDHSTLGGIDAMAFCQAHGFTPRESRLVKWLVDHHLLMSTVAQKQDITNPEVIHSFALTVGDMTHLDYLYTLTVADMCATNPNIWNGWRDQLLSQLYFETKRALHRGLENALNRQELIEETKQATLEGIRNKGIDEQKALSLWQIAGDDYFLKETADDIIWHTEAILNHVDAHTPLVLVKKSYNRAGHQVIQIFIRTDAKQNVFAVAATALDKLRLNIQDARIYSTVNHYTMDTFYAINKDAITNDNDSEFTEKIKRTLTSELSLIKHYRASYRPLIPRQLKHFTSPTYAHIDNTISDDYSVLEVTSPDRPGLLAIIGRIFVELNIRLVNAKISTLGERVEDVFYITDKTDRRLNDTQLCETLKQMICRQLDTEILDSGQTLA